MGLLFKHYSNCKAFKYNILIYLLILFIIINKRHCQSSSLNLVNNNNNNQQYLILERFTNGKFNKLLPSGEQQQINSYASQTTTSNILKNINNVAYYNGYLYVGAQNWLLKLNAVTLQIEQSVRYGPVLDSPNCRYWPIEECLFSSPSSSNQDIFYQQQQTPSSSSKSLLNNFNKLLIIYEQRNALLTCWSARQGVCDLRDLNDITQVIQNTSISTVANDPFNTTIGFIASSANSQDLFYVASTYNNLGPYRDEIPALAGRSLTTTQNNRFMQILTSNSQGLKSSKASIEFMSRYTKSFIVKYINAFNLGIYNYFLTVQHMDTDAFNKGELLITKLARLCLNDLSFTKSYIEMPLKCTSGSSSSVSSLRSIDYNELINARVVNIKSFNTNEQDNYYIVGLFQQTNRNTFNATLQQDTFNQDEPIKQAVCMFSLKQIQHKVKENLRKCYSSSTDLNKYNNIMRGLNFIKPDQQCSSAASRNNRLRQSEYGSGSSSSFQINDDFCSSADNGLYPIGGQIPLVSNAILEFDTSSSNPIVSNYFDTIQLYSNSIATTLLLLSNRRQELRFFHMKSLTSPPINYRTVRLDENQPLDDLIESDTVKVSLSNLQFEQQSQDDRTPPNLFVVSSRTSQILKIKMSSCDQFKTCGECLSKSSTFLTQDGDPYCGWCSTTNECTTHSKCMISSSSTSNEDSTSSKWLNGQQLIKNNNFTSNLFDSVCVDIKSIEPLFTYKGQSDWIEINFAKELSNVNQTDGPTNYKCVFLAPSSTSNNEHIELRTDAVQLGLNKLKCSMPHLTKIQQLFQSNSYLEQNLVLSEDGLFYVSIDGNYYYEQRYDRIHLPIYVQSIQSPNLKYGSLSSSSKKSSSETLFNITIIDCSAHKSCVSCSATNACKWCSNRCLNQNEPLSLNDNQCMNEVNKCESFDTGTNKLLIPYTAHRQQAPLVFGMKNFNINNNKIECMFTLFNGKFINGKNISVPFLSINKTHAHCSLLNVFSLLNDLIENNNVDILNTNNNNGQVQTNLRLYDLSNDIFIDSISNGKLSLLFYKCELKATDCSQCLSLNRQYSCMWCNNVNNPKIPVTVQQPTTSSCKFMNAQSKMAAISQCISPINHLFTSITNQTFNQCDRPQINNIQPTKIPIAGGTILTITGINLGSTFEDIVGVYIACGDSTSLNSTYEYLHTKCDLIQNKYVPSKQIGCKTRQSKHGVQHNCKITIKLKTNLVDSSNPTAILNNNMYITGSQVIKFVDPVISEIQPSTIIQSANFVWLNLKGIDLDAGRSRQIHIIDFVNQNENYQINSNDQSLNSRIIKCEIKNVTNTDIKCRLNDKFRTLGKKNVKLIFDDNMSIMHYLSLRVTSDPLVKSIDKQMTMYTGGTQFRLYGFNFDAVQSAYTYVNYREIWYSEPVPARTRISNEYILFDFPQLTESFFDTVKQQQLVFTLSSSKSIVKSTIQEKYELQIGFLMDGFNVTLKDIPITYLPPFNSKSIIISNLDIQLTQNSNDFSLIMDFKIDESILSNINQYNLLRDDLQIYIGCSQCSKLVWLNDTKASCQLPLLTAKNITNSTQFQCEQKAFNSILNKLNQNKLSMIHLYVGNYELEQENEFTELNQNLKIYIQTYMVNNVDDYVNLATALSRMASSNINTNELLKYNTNALVNSNANSLESLIGGGSSKNLLLISAVISALLIMLIVFTVILVTVILKMKLKNNLDDTSSTSKEINSNLNSLVLLKKPSQKVTLLAKGSMSCSTNSKKNEKQLKIEYERIKQQIDQLELQIRPKCTQLFQLLHQDYINDLNNELLLKLQTGAGLPIWNYKTYLFNLLFPTTSTNLNSLLAIEMPSSNQNQTSNTSPSSASTSSSTTTPLLMPNTQAISTITAKSLLIQNNNHAFMSLSSMSNSTTNTLLSSTLQQNNMYATIKSGKFDPHELSSVANNTNIIEAMTLFDQLMHNKNFLLTFVQVCESQQSFTPKDKSNLSSLLILSLRDNLPYLYSIIKSLLSDYISNSFQTNSTTSTKSNKNNQQQTARQLFRSNETLIEKLLTNWISMFMFEFNNTTQTSTNLYRLIKVIKYYLDMGPIDQLTQMASNSLNDEFLLEDEYNYQTIYINVLNRCIISSDTQSNINFQVCRLLDCDTIQQAKEKIIESIYSKPIINQLNGCGNLLMTRPNSRDVDLELCLLLIQNDIDPNTQQKQQTTTIVLKETEDELIGSSNDYLNNNNNKNNSAPKRLLTLKDYNIQNGSFLNLVYKQQYLNQNMKTNEQNSNNKDNQNHVYMSTLSMNNEYCIYGSNSNSNSNQTNSAKLPLPLPLVPPPPLPISKQNRFHLVKPSSGAGSSTSPNPLISFSTTDSTSSSSSSESSSASGTVVLSLTAKQQRKSNKKKKYEKLMTVKSQDSAGSSTTASLIEHNPNTGNKNINSSLTRLLINKGTIQPFIDQFFETIFANTSSLPPVIQHLFEFLDQEAKKYQYQFVSLNSKDTARNLGQVNDEMFKITRNWKTNSYFIKYWANLLKNPEYLLDVDKNNLIDSSLSSIVSAFLDSCTINESFNLYDTNSTSPINRLLYLHEVPRYKEMIDNFYKEMSSYQPISDHELHFYLNEFSKCLHQQFNQQQIGSLINTPTTSSSTTAINDINSLKVLLQLYEYYEKYEQQINASLGQQQCSILLPVHHRLVQIKDLMMMNNNHHLNHQQSSFMLANNPAAIVAAATLNRQFIHQQQQFQYNPYQQLNNSTSQYQQPVNCYATTNDLIIQSTSNTNNLQQSQQQQQQHFF